MVTKLSTALCALALLAFGSISNAASVSLSGLNPPNPVALGDIITIDVVWDFSEDPTLGGGFDVIFDATQLKFVSVTSANLGDPAFYRDPDVTPGLLVSWAAGDFGGLTGGTIGSVSFEVLTSDIDTMVTLADTSGVAGPFTSAVTYQVQNPDYFGVHVYAAVVPVPAAAWLFGSALLGLAGIAGRRK